MSFSFGRKGMPYYNMRFLPEMEDIIIYKGSLRLSLEGNDRVSVYSEEDIDRAVTAFCSVLHKVSPIEATKHIAASGYDPEFSFPE
ncbi:hypothetical protein GCM10009799_06110 [Nocardiopsis rhodophaea]|uniref:Uncharacterized protein n=1 Tax=Nocardiopsis rhodophaea TaxID=280238 RepID=A0ABN2SD11_9ACTN